MKKIKIILISVTILFVAAVGLFLYPHLEFKQFTSEYSQYHNEIINELSVLSRGEFVNGIKDSEKLERMHEYLITKSSYKKDQDIKSSLKGSMIYMR